MARRIASLSVLLVFVVGVPILLLHMTGLPVVDDLPDLKGLEKAIELRWIPVDWVVAILALAAWTLWAYLALAVVIRIAGQIELRLRSAGSLWAASEAFAWSPVKVIVDLALGAALITSSVTGSARAAAAASRGPGWSFVIAPQMEAVRAETATTSTSDGVVKQSPKEPSSRKSTDLPKHDHQGASNGYSVRPGDSLWSIAEAKLGDPYRWTDVWKLNRGREVGDGERLERPGFIRPGWTLVLPGERTHDDRDHNQEKSASESAHEKRTDRRSARMALENNGSSPSSTHHAAPSSEHEPATPTNQDDSETGRRIELPSGTAVALGFVSGFLSALGLRQLLKRRARRPQPLTRGWPSARTEPTLKARLIGALVPNREQVEAESIRAMEQVVTSPTQVILGHRDGIPVITNQRGTMYFFTGEKPEVISYMRDLALHTLVSHGTATEVWTNEDLGMAGLRGLRTFNDARNLVSELEIEILKRHRMFDEEEIESWESHQEVWPDDPLPLVIAITADDIVPLHNRLGAVSTQGQDLGLLVFGRGSGSEGIHVERNILSPDGEVKRFLGEPFDAIRFDQRDREELLQRLAGEAISTEPTHAVQEAPQSRPDSEPLVRVKLFGPPEIPGLSDANAGGFGPKSRELLFFYLLHPQGASREQAVAALWPETDPEEGANRFKFQLHLIRKCLRSETIPTAKFIELVNDIYRPSPDLFDVDVWEFDRLIGEAIKGRDERSLTAATDLYCGELLEGVYYSWAETIQSHFQSRFLDAVVHLSDLQAESGDLEAATRNLHRAIRVDPYAEHLYRKLMTLYGRLGRRVDIDRTYRELEAALAEGLEVDPDPETETLKNRLLASPSDLRS